MWFGVNANQDRFKCNLLPEEWIFFIDIVAIQRLRERDSKLWTMNIIYYNSSLPLGYYTPLKYYVKDR